MFERYYRELQNFLSGKVQDRHTACDLVQESYVRVLGMQQSGEIISDARALLYRVARNLLVDRIRHDSIRHHEDLHELPEWDEPIAPTHQQPEAALHTAQVLAAYQAAIDALPPRCREAFVLHVFEEVPQAEVAQRMGISRSMVEKHIVRGMLACRACRRALDAGETSASLAQS